MTSIENVAPVEKTSENLAQMKNTTPKENVTLRKYNSYTQDNHYREHNS